MKGTGIAENTRTENSFTAKIVGEALIMETSTTGSSSRFSFVDPLFSDAASRRFLPVAFFFRVSDSTTPWSSNRVASWFVSLLNLVVVSPSYRHRSGLVGNLHLELAILFELRPRITRITAGFAEEQRGTATIHE